MKILNLYAGIGGNRKLWDGHEITAVENDPQIAQVYNALFPQDTVVLGDAHQYLLDHHTEFDFIWTSPPCPSHSRLNTQLYAQGYIRYPDMALYQEIIFLKHFFKGKWVAENVIPYYKPLIHPQVIIERHPFWANFHIPPLRMGLSTNIINMGAGALGNALNIVLPPGVTHKGDFKRKILRNAVHPEIGLHILNAAMQEEQQAAIRFI